mmetsp:Transcript_11553/g.27627  ORF Transcript_11553/g.27627 Transcript_11553/m.27627 type:complete len:746 (+) Transcript_11553:71-2308(+)
MALTLAATIPSKMENDESDTSASSNPSNRRQQIVIGTVVLVCSVFMFLWSASSTTDSFSDPVDIVVRKTRIVRHDEDDMKCLQLCTARRVERSKYFFGSGTITGSSSSSNNNNHTTTPTKDFIDADRNDIVKLIKSAKERLLTKLRTDYGEQYFQDMYVDAEGRYRPFYPVTPDGDSWSILKRKLIIKLLSAQVTSKQQESNVDGICDCLTNKVLSASAGRRRLETNDGRNSDPNVTSEEEPEIVPPAPASSVVETVFERYVWSTGGHSAAAAHGNMFNESYTSYMESDLVDVFASVGIEFEGRNYAMGGTGSAAEIAMCWEEIFGTDVDMFSWDYGMTDGNLPNKLFFYGYRGGLSTGHPAVVGIHLNGRSRRGREDSLKELEKYGMASFYSLEEEMGKQRDAIPDTSGMSEADIAALPEFVRSFKCGGQIEKGDPYCSKEKYTDFACQRRSAKAGWHPGYKDHALIGHGMSLFMVDALLEAATDLASHDMKDPEALLSQLRSEDESQFEKFRSTDIDDKFKNLFQVTDDIQANFSSTVFYQGRSFCHTGRTPSRSRYLGHLTNTDMIGGPSPPGLETYDVGIEDTEALKNPSTDGTMRLVWTKHKEREDCEYTVKPDYKDYFMTTDKDVGWTKLVFPNEAERLAYRYNPSDVNGIVVFVLRVCSWGKCEAGYLDWGAYDAKKWEMKINGRAVASVHDIGHGAILAKGEDGSIYFPVNVDGVYEIEVNVNEVNSFVKISSIIIY